MYKFLVFLLLDELSSQLSEIGKNHAKQQKAPDTSSIGLIQVSLFQNALHNHYKVLDFGVHLKGFLKFGNLKLEID